MLDRKNSKLLITIAQSSDTPPAARVSACALLHRTNELCASDIQKILQEVIDDYRTKRGVQVKALDLLDKVSQDTGVEPDLSAEDEQLVRTSLMEQFVCQNPSN